MNSNKNNLINIYIIPPIALIGLAFNILCFVIFSNKDLKEKFYKYLKLELIFIGINQLYQILRPFIKDESHWLYKTLFIKVIQIYLSHYFVSVIEMTALILHLLSSFNYYVLVAASKNDSFIMKKMRKIDKISHPKITIFVFSFSLVAFLFQIFRFQIESYKEISIQNITSTVYYLNDTVFSQTYICKFLILFTFSFRDGFVLLLLIISNIFIYKEAKNAFKKKKYLAKKLKLPSTDHSINQTSNQKSLKIDNNSFKLTLMMFCINVNFIVGRLPILMSFVFDTFYPEMKTFNYRLFEVSALTIFLSYASFFFLYYYFNKQFRKIFWKYFNQVNQVIFKQ